MITPKLLLSNHDEYNFRDESFEMDDSFEVKKDIGRISLKGSDLLTEGNIMTVVMRPGVGKSSLCEAICAGGINTSVDAFGFIVNIGDGDILFVDTERTINDFGKGYKKIVIRSRAFQEKGIMQGGKLVRLKAHSYRVLDNAEKYIKHLEGHLKSGNYTLVLLDQAADFLKSINNEAEAMQFVRKLEYLATTYSTAFLVTIHPNPMDKTFKPNGWIGSYLLKKSETVMAGYKAENGIRILTTEFEHGKVRNAYEKVETAFKWSEEDHMHMSIELTDNIKDTVKKYEFIDKIIYEIFDKVGNWLPNDLVAILKEKVPKKHIETITEDFLKNYSVDMGIIQKFGVHYTLVTDSDENSVPF